MSVAFAMAAARSAGGVVAASAGSAARATGTHNKPLATNARTRRDADDPQATPNGRLGQLPIRRRIFHVVPPGSRTAMLTN